MSLLRKKCTDCNFFFNTIAHTPYCNCCIKYHCDLSHMKDSVRRHNCNSTFDLIYRKHTLCVGHYKMLQNYCYVCGDCRSACDKLSYDDYYYCEEHKPICQKILIAHFLNQET